MFTRAIVRAPPPTFGRGISTALLGPPDFEKTLQQHAGYCAALEECGLDLTTLGANPEHPDSAFVEDTAILTPAGAILARPGAPERRSEAAAMAPVVREFFPDLREIVAPGALDGGDVCQAGDQFFIGISSRTNEHGASQLARHLGGFGYASAVIDVRSVPGLLHLKSGIACVARNALVVVPELARMDAFRSYELILVSPEESYAANCVRVNRRVLVPAGRPRVLAELCRRGLDPLVLEMSEFQKMDGGLSCLSLRF